MTEGLVLVSAGRGPRCASCGLAGVCAVGLGVEEFGGNTVIVTRYPALLGRRTPAEILKRVVDHLTSKERLPTREQLLSDLMSIGVGLAFSIVAISLMWLRTIRPDMPRPFVIPWGRTGLLYAVAAPVVMSIVALLGSDRYALLWGPLAIGMGPLVYWMLKRVR